MPTREGTTVALLAAAIFLLATNLMSGLLFVLDALLVSLLCVGAASSFLPLRGLRVTHQAPARGTEGAEVPVEVTLCAARGGRFLSAEDGWPLARARVLVVQLTPGAPVTVTVRPKASRRGLYHLGPTEIASRGLVGLFVARRRFAGSERITIWPRTRPVPSQVLAYLAPALEDQRAERTREPEELYGVRDYQAGDSLARIHWRSSVRRGALVVREFERPRAEAAALVIDLDRRQPPARLDAAVRAAASVMRLAHDRGAEIMLAGWEEGLVERRGWEAAMDWLAGVVPCGPPLAEVLPALAGYARHLIVVAALPAAPTQTGMTFILPAEDLASLPGAHTGLVYTEDGAVQAW